MAKLILVEETLDVEHKGTTYNLRFPSWGEIEAMAEKKEDPKGESTTLFLESCGLPKEITKSMQAKHIQLILENLMGGGKKN